MSLEGSPRAPQQYNATYEFITSLREIAGDLPIVLFQHVPLHKPSGSCPGDAPYINRTESGFIVEQTLLSEEWSEYIVHTIHPVLVFSGHDHEGCSFEHTPYTRELTLRSMMGDYSGHAGIVQWGVSE